MSLFCFFKKKKTDNADTVNPKEENKVRYEYDAKVKVLIKCSSGETPKIIKKSDLVWRNFGPQDDSYARAIFLGQGCWERLDTISEEMAHSILLQWGYSFHDE